MGAKLALNKHFFTLSGSMSSLLKTLTDLRYFIASETDFSFFILGIIFAQIYDINFNIFFKKLILFLKGGYLNGGSIHRGLEMYGLK